MDFGKKKYATKHRITTLQYYVQSSTEIWQWSLGFK